MTVIVSIKDHITLLVVYPQVMKHTSAQLIVLFSGVARGTVLHPGDSNYAIGYYSEAWAPEDFKNYNEPVTIENIV
jgi:hypothetical protein